MNKKDIQKLLKNKKFVMCAAIVLAFLILIICLKLIVFSGETISKYGNRLDGIKDIKFTKDDKNKIVETIKSNESVTDAKLNVHGRIVNVVFNVNKDVTKDAAIQIATDSLGNFSDSVKGFYDIEYIITNNDEEGTKETITSDDGSTKEVTNKNYPIMGYKNSSSKELVW